MFMIIIMPNCSLLKNSYVNKFIKTSYEEIISSTFVVIFPFRNFSFSYSKIVEIFAENKQKLIEINCYVIENNIMSTFSHFNIFNTQTQFI